MGRSKQVPETDNRASSGVEGDPNNSFKALRTEHPSIH